MLNFLEKKLKSAVTIIIRLSTTGSLKTAIVGVMLILGGSLGLWIANTPIEYSDTSFSSLFSETDSLNSELPSSKHFRRVVPKATYYGNDWLSCPSAILFMAGFAAVSPALAKLASSFIRKCWKVAKEAIYGLFYSAAKGIYEASKSREN